MQHLYRGVCPRQQVPSTTGGGLQLCLLPKHPNPIVACLSFFMPPWLWVAAAGVWGVGGACAFDRLFGKSTHPYQSSVRYYIVLAILFSVQQNEPQWMSTPHKSSSRVQRRYFIKKSSRALETHEKGNVCANSITRLFCTLRLCAMRYPYLSSSMDIHLLACRRQLIRSHIRQIDSRTGRYLLELDSGRRPNSLEHYLTFCPA